MKNKIAIIGAGYMASEYLKVLIDKKNIEVVGIVGKSRKNLRKIQKIKKIKIFKSIKELYKITKPHGVICAVNEIFTKKVLKDLTRFKWKILCEKPIGINYSEAIKINNFKNKKNIYLALNRDFFSSTLVLKKLLVKDNNPRIVEILDQEVPKLSTSNKIRIKNWMYCNSIHLVNYIKLLGRGKIKKITNFGSIKKNMIFSKIIFSSGDIFFYRALWDRPGPWSLTVSTKKNFYILKPLEDLKILNIKRKETIFSRPIVDSKYKPGLYIMISNFINALNNKSHQLKQIKDNTQLMKLIKDIYNV